MKNKITKLFLVLMLSGFTANAQTSEEREQIVKDYNHEWLEKFEKTQREKWDKDYELAVSIAEKKGLPLSGTDEEGNYFELVGVIEGSDNLKYYKTNKVNAKDNVLFNNGDSKSSIQTARVQSLHNGSSTGNVIIEGQSMIVGEWDGGTVYAAHKSLGVNRVTMKDNSTGQVTNNGTDHATHVAGTMIANNNNPLIKGMAPAASLWANNWLQDTSEMTAQSRQGLLVSNHSYGIGYYQAGFHNNPSELGRYNSSSRILDDLLYEVEYYLPVYAAGNDRNGEWTGSQTVYFNPSKNGEDLLHGEGTSKNNVVVAAIDGITNYQQPSDVVMSSFSNWGPTDDYRIKPDISAKGVAVNSVGTTSDTATKLENGTSMAAPSVAGVFVLWQQYFKELYPTKGKMRSATVKALMAISADEAGATDGPDYRFGWGVINAKKGAEILRDSKPGVDRSHVLEHQLSNGTNFEIEVEIAGDGPLKAALAWTDPAGRVSGGNDDTTSVLVNDLDLRVVRVSNGDIGLPWAINKSPNNKFVAKMDNDRDPLEVVEYKGQVSGVAAAGKYKIIVTHKGALTGGSQKFSLIVSGIKGKVVSVKEQQFDNLVVYPNPVNDIVILKADLASIAGANTQIFDMSGKQVYENRDLFYNTNEASVNISFLNSGIYLLKLSNGEINQTIKIVKK